MMHGKRTSPGLSFDCLVGGKTALQSHLLRRNHNSANLKCRFPSGASKFTANPVRPRIGLLLFLFGPRRLRLIPADLLGFQGLCRGAAVQPCHLGDLSRR